MIFARITQWFLAVLKRRKEQHDALAQVSEAFKEFEKDMQKIKKEMERK